MQKTTQKSSLWFKREVSIDDAPVWFNDTEAQAWASGWNACVDQMQCKGVDAPEDHE